MRKFQLPLIALLTAGLLTIAFIGCKKDLKSPTLTSDAKTGKSAGAYDPVTLSFISATQHSFTLQVQAGPSGAPAGFSIQWMTRDAFIANGSVWPDYDSDAPNFCKASFSGVPYGGNNSKSGGSTYNLGSNGIINVVIGDLTADELNDPLGYSATCWDALQCGTRYVFRAFAHADATKTRSSYSILDDASVTTDPCGSCTRYGLGHWRNDSLAVANIIDPTGDNSGTLLLGDHAYTAGQIYSILLKTPNGNGLVTLAHQLITAKLNNICQTDWSLADAQFVGKIVPPVGNSSVQPSTVAGLVATLQGINNSCVECSIQP